MFVIEILHIKASDNIVADALSRVGLVGFSFETYVGSNICRRGGNV